MSSIELTFVIPIILGIIILVLVASYFVAHLIDFELHESMIFLSELLNKSSSETKTSVFKEETYRSVEKLIVFPIRDNQRQNGLVVESTHRYTRTRRIWLLLTSFFYEGGIDYFNEKK